MIFVVHIALGRQINGKGDASESAQEAGASAWKPEDAAGCPDQSKSAVMPAEKLPGQEYMKKFSIK